MKRAENSAADGAYSVLSSTMHRLRTLLGGDPVLLAAWLDKPRAGRLAWLAAAAAAGLALYGFSTGYWRSPLMGVYVAVKMPLLIALTLVCNGMLNGLMGLLLGSGLGFRQSLLALLMSFAVAAMVLGALAPVTFFLAWNAPSPDSPQAGTAHAAYLVCHTFLIGYAGVIANVHLHRLLVARAPDRRIAAVTLAAWLGGNAFVGAQFSWILRPFFGSPGLEVAFLRPDPLRGTFYQAVWRSLVHLTGGEPFPAALALMVVVAAIALPVLAAMISKPVRFSTSTPTMP